jgi:putative transposase
LNLGHLLFICRSFRNKGQRRNRLPWKERKALDEKQSLIEEWERREENLAELCRRYEISRQTGYKWLERYQQEGEPGLEERSRAPLHHPQAMLPKVRDALVELRIRHPSWGPRKLRAYQARSLRTPSNAIESNNRLRAI